MVLPFYKYGLRFRTVEVEDAAFIVELRNDEALARFLSKTSPDVEHQKEWLREYKKREELNQEAYFVALDKNQKRLGLNRLYNFEEDCFEIGSWIYSAGLDLSTPILGDLAVRDYGFETLGFSTCRFVVRKANLQVLKYHVGFNPRQDGETDLDYLFSLSYENYKKQRDKLLKLLDYELG